jgi:hypothetical protein
MPYFDQDDYRRLDAGVTHECEREPELQPNSGLVDLDAALRIVRARIEWEREEDRRRREAFVALDARGEVFRASLPSVFRRGEGRGLRALVPMAGAALLIASLGANAFAYARVQAHEQALVGALAERRAATRQSFAKKDAPKAPRLAAVETPREAWLPPEPTSPSVPAVPAREPEPSPRKVSRIDGALAKQGAKPLNSPPPRDDVSAKTVAANSGPTALREDAPTLPVSPPAPADLGAAMRAAVGLGSAAPESPVPMPVERPLEARTRETNPDVKQVRPAPGAIVSALRAVQDSARACLAAGDPPRVHAVVFGPDGRVLRVEPQLRDEKTPCIDAALSRARVDAFSEEGYRARVTVRP